MYRSLWFGLVSTLWLTAATVEYQRDVQPILAERCFGCHGGDKRSGGLSLRDYGEAIRGGRNGPIILPGGAAESLIIHRVTSETAPMPPAGARLSPAQIDILRRWIDEGARATASGPPARQPWIAKLELTAPPVPPGTGHPIDRFVGKYLREHSLTMSAPVSDAVFMRRAYLDAWGLLPLPEEQNRFLADRDPLKRAKLVDRLLADSRNYAEHWITFWNDLLRNDEGVNYAGTRKSITPWLHGALKDNLSYDRFLQKLLNPASPADPDGFLAGVNWRGDVNASQRPQIQAAQNTAQIFLGINLKCNSCHDSFINRWKLKDAYGLAGFFSTEDRLELVRCDNPTGQFTGAKFLYPELDLPSPPQSLGERRAAAARMFTDPRNGRAPRTMVNRIWARLLGRGLVADVDDMDQEPWSPELLDWLAADFVTHGYDLKHVIATVMKSQAYQLPAVRRPTREIADYVFRGPEVRRMTAEQFVDALSTATGEWPILTPGQSTRSVYSRHWQVGSTTLTRALGRPIRDQVFTDRNHEATTLQALELVNGSVVTRLLARGVQRMLGRIPRAPDNLFDSGRINVPKPVTVKADVTGAKELRLLTTDVLSYSPDRVVPAWAETVLVNAAGETTPLSSLQPVFGKLVKSAVTFSGKTYTDGIRTELPAELIYNLEGKDFVELRGLVGLEESCIQDEISPRVRFFVFKEKPDPEQLMQVDPARPAPALQISRVPAEASRSIFQFLLGRPPSAAEARNATGALSAGSGQVTAEGLADLLWAVAMQPEFQLIY